MDQVKRSFSKKIRISLIQQVLSDGPINGSGKYISDGGRQRDKYSLVIRRSAEPQDMAGSSRLKERETQNGAAKCEIILRLTKRMMD